MVLDDEWNLIYQEEEVKKFETPLQYPGPPGIGLYVLPLDLVL